jgi:hypothetical protein
VLDIVLTNVPSCYTCATHPSVGTSEHAVVVCKASPTAYAKTRPKTTKVEVRDNKISNTVNALRQIDWFSSIDSLATNPQTSFDRLYQLISEAEERFQPLRMMKIKGDKPW